MVVGATADRFSEGVPVAVPAPPREARGAFPARVARTISFIWSRRLYLPPYWMMVLRFLWLKIRRPYIRTEGFVFIDKDVQLHARKGYGRLTLGRWVFIGRGNRIRCHEGNLRIGDKVVFGAKNTINCYLDVDIGPDCIFADWIYICDFDHRFDDLTTPIRKQGIVKSPVRIGADCWFGEKTTVLRGVTVGDGCVIASHALVNKDIPPRSVVGGVPARVLRTRTQGGQRGSAAPAPTAEAREAPGDP